MGCEDIDALGTIPLPRSFLFHDIATSPASEGSEYEDIRLKALSCSPCHTPVTLVPLPPEDQCALSDALHGWHLRQQREYEDSRMLRYKTLDRQVFLEEIYIEMSRFRREYDELGVVICTLHPVPFYYTISQQWKARWFLSLFNDVQAVKKEADSFIHVYIERWMKIQY